MRKVTLVRLPHLRTLLGTLCLLGCAATPTLARDYWFSFSPLFPEPSDTCTLRLLVGDQLEPELERPLDKSITSRYEWISGPEVENLLEAVPDSTLPVLTRRLGDAESALVIMDRSFVTVEGTIEDLRYFLEHEDQLEILQQVARVAPRTAVVRRYCRNLKTLIQSGIKDETWLHAHVVGQSLEVVLFDDPRTLAAGDKLRAQVLFRGKPLAGELVQLLVRGDSGEVTQHKATTSEHGLVTFRGSQSGFWALRVTHVVPGDAGADWDTYYATFSFMVL